MKVKNNEFCKDWLESLPDHKLEALRHDTARHLRRVPIEEKSLQAMRFGLPQIRREIRLRRA